MKVELFTLSSVGKFNGIWAFMREYEQRKSRKAKGEQGAKVGFSSDASSGGEEEMKKGRVTVREDSGNEMEDDSMDE